MSDAENKSHAEIVDRIRKFLAMTVERGAGEAEAIFAARKAAELMAEYDISLTDLEDKPQGHEAIFTTYVFDPEFTRAVYRILDAISSLCHVRTFVAGPLAGKISMIGLDVDTKIAEYLLNVCINAMKHEVDKASRAWLLQVRMISRKRASFLDGLAVRLEERLQELAWARSRSGNALVVITDDVVDDVLKRRGVERGSSLVRGREGDEESRTSGKRAADTISLNNALGGGDAASASVQSEKQDKAVAEGDEQEPEAGDDEDEVDGEAR